MAPLRACDCYMVGCPTHACAHSGRVHGCAYPVSPGGVAKDALHPSEFTHLTSRHVDQVFDHANDNLGGLLLPPQTAASEVPTPFSVAG